MGFWGDLVSGVLTEIFFFSEHLPVLSGNIILGPVFFFFMYDFKMKYLLSTGWLSVLTI